MITAPAPTRRLPGPLSASALALAAALALAGCEAQPIGALRAAPRSPPPREAGALHALLPARQRRAGAGEAQRLTLVPRGRCPWARTTDILLEVGNSGSAVLDARRLQTLRRTFAAHAGAGAGGRADTSAR